MQVAKTQNDCIVCGLTETIETPKRKMRICSPHCHDQLIKSMQDMQNNLEAHKKGEKKKIKAVPKTPRNSISSEES